MDETPFYKPFTSNDFTYESCFLCGQSFADVQRTDEHIFPKWLQHKFDLWDQTLQIINGSTIQYRLLTIPCCKECNGVHLSKMEESFRTLLGRRFNDLTDEDEKVIFQWTAKVLYGTLYKELSLLLDRRNPNLGKILTPEVIESYHALHLFLQSIRVETVFAAPKPWSIFVFEYEDDGFHYMNEINSLCFSIKLGDIGITIAFEDNNIIEGYMSRLKELRRFKLNDIQFVEVSTLIFYAKKLALNAPRYLSNYFMPTKTLTVNTLGSLSGRDWDDEEYCYFFEYMLKRHGFNIEGPFYKDGNVTTTLVDKDGIPMVHKVPKHS